MSPTTSLANNLLVAMPSLADGNFAQSVTLICEHSDKGALGIVLNKPLDMKLGDVLAQMKLDTDAGGHGRAARAARRAGAYRSWFCAASARR